MKVGDTVAVNIGQAEVANAKVVEFGDGTATLVIPATRVVMSVITQLDTSPTQTGGNEHAILGVESREPATPDTPPVPADGSNVQTTETAGVQSVEAPSALETPVQQPADGVVADSNNVGQSTDVGTTGSSSGAAE